MKHDYTVDLSAKGIDTLIKAMDRYKKWLEQKTSEFISVLADKGMHLATVYFQSATYDGVNDVKVSVEQRGENCAAVVAVGSAVLFIEFGAGYLMGGSEYGAKYGFGPGTYPGQTHAFDPEGWYLPKAVQAETGKEKSYGNPPAAAMYSSVKELEIELEKIAKEVFV